MMKHWAKYFIFSGFVAFWFIGCCFPKSSESLAVTLHPQETDMWCWAASGQMVMHYLGNNVSQCTQANNRFGRTDCCHSPTPNACANGGWPEFSKYGFAFEKTADAPLTWNQIKEEISTEPWCGKRPFCFTWHWAGGGGHMMVAIGYTTIEGVNHVEVNDPGPPNLGGHYFLPYSAYVSGSGYTHWDDYYHIHRR